MSLESSKTLSGIGAILIAVGSLTSLSGFMGILSLIRNNFSANRNERFGRLLWRKRNIR